MGFGHTMLDCFAFLPESVTCLGKGLADGLTLNVTCLPGELFPKF